MARGNAGNLLSWTLCLVLWGHGNWPNLLNGYHLILLKPAWKDACYRAQEPSLGIGVLSSSEIKEKSPSSRFWISRFFSKEIFLLCFSGMLLICNPTEWVKNVFWSHTNMWSSEHWWHSTTKENRGGGISKWLDDKRDFRSEPCISGKGVTQWADCDQLTFHQWVAAQVFGGDALIPLSWKPPKVLIKCLLSFSCC